MSVLSSLLARKPSRERPDLASWIAGAAPVLVVDGDGSGSQFPGATVLAHVTSGGPGLPFHDRDPRRLDEKDASMKAVALLDLLDKVLDVGFAVDEARRVLAPGGRLLIVQTVAPDDYEDRAIWNALARMRDPRHTWTATARQTTAMLGGWKMPQEREAEWEESADPRATRRPDAAGSLGRMVDAASGLAAGNVVRDGALVLVRRAFLLRRD